MMQIPQKNPENQIHPHIKKIMHHEEAGASLEFKIGLQLKINHYNTPYQKNKGHNSHDHLNIT